MLASRKITSSKLPFNSTNILIMTIILLHQVQTKILFLFEHCRHGARSMTHLSDNDLDIIGEKWSGEAELSYVGMRQHYLLGVHTKKKYPDIFTGTQYNPDDIIVYATNSNRTIMSAQAQLIGIYKTLGDEEKLTEEEVGLATLPFEIKDEKMKEFISILGKSTLPNDTPLEVPILILDTRDKVFQFEKNGGCPPIKTLRKESQSKDVIVDFEKKFNNTFGSQLLRHFNIQNDSDRFSKYDNIGDITGGIIINTVDGRDLSRFQRSGINLSDLINKSYEYANLASTQVQAQDSKKEIAMAGSSVLMRKILSYMDAVVENDKNQKNAKIPKSFFLSAHDGTLVVMEDFFKVIFDTNIQYPVFASNLFIELEKVENSNSYQVNLVFNDDIIKSIKYEEFKSTIEEKAWTYEQTGLYCGFIIKNIKIWKISTICLGIGLLLLTILLGVVVFLNKRRKPLEVMNRPLVE